MPRVFNRSTGRNMTENETYDRQPIVLDGEDFMGCTFNECRFIYSGGRLPWLVDCTLNRCSFSLEGAAAETVEFLKALTSLTEGGEQLVVHDMLELTNWKANDDS